jgi:hypothetical protein
VKSAFSRLNSRRGLWRDSKEIAYYAEISDIKDWRFWVFIYNNNGLACLHASAVLNRARDAAGNIERWTNCLSCLTHLM